MRIIISPTNLKNSPTYSNPIKNVPLAKKCYVPVPANLNSPPKTPSPSSHPKSNPNLSVNTQYTSSVKLH